MISYTEDLLLQAVGIHGQKIFLHYLDHRRLVNLLTMVDHREDRQEDRKGGRQ